MPSRRTLRAIGEYRGKQALFYRQAPEVLKGLRETAVIQSSESSNRLEGVIVSAKRLKALMAHNTTPKDRSEQEVAGCRDALALIHESAREMRLSPRPNPAIALDTAPVHAGAGRAVESVG